VGAAEVRGVARYDEVGAAARGTGWGSGSALAAECGARVVAVAAERERIVARALRAAAPGGRRNGVEWGGRIDP